MSSKNDAMIEVVFKVHARVDLGEELRVSGNVPALGCDNPDRAVPMVTTPAEFPWWRTKEDIFLPGGGDFRYRYCTYSGGKFNRWEADGKIYRQLNYNQNADIPLIHTEDKFGRQQFVQHDPEVSPVKFYATETQSVLSKKYSEFNRMSAANNQLVPNDAVIIVSYFLPVTLTRVKEGNGWQAQWDKENILSLQMNSRLIWVGSVRYNNAPIPVEEEEAVSAALQELNCVPVFISHNMHYQFYDIFCKKNLWPIMHHIADVYGPLNLNDIGAKSQQNLWFVYSTVHKMFRSRVLEVFQEDYLIWIHGFHLMLLPSFLRRRLPMAKIGYFFHTPFPSSEIWRTMFCREDLLRGILGADQIGFHLYEYARHFLTNCQRILGISKDSSSSGKMTVSVDGRHVTVSCIHVGVDIPRCDEVLQAPTFAGQVGQWKERFGNKVVVAGIDRLERLKGIPLKLMAIDEFMEENPHWLGKIVFALIGISAGERGLDYRQTQHDVKIIVKNINAKYAERAGSDGHKLVHFEEKPEKEIRLAQRLAFFAGADVLMMTSTRDGLNRYPMEYTLARDRYGQMTGAKSGIGIPQHGLILLSEFVSSARVMRGALIVNPWRVTEVKAALKTALEMGSAERADRNRRNLDFSRRLTTATWAQEVLKDLKAVEKSNDPNTSFAVGFGLHYKVMDLKAGFKALDSKEVCKSYRAARHRLILLDWGGTIVEARDKTDKLKAYAIATGHAARESVSTDLLSLLQSLCSDQRNKVFIVSGKEQRAVVRHFGEVPGLGLGAEHGFYYKWPRDDEYIGGKMSKGRWHTIMEVGDQTWKESAKALMEIFAQRTHGTYIEQKGNALIWQFSDADPEFGFMQSKELVEHLQLVLAPFKVEIIRGGGVSDGYIEVRPAGASKGLFLEHCLSVAKSSGNAIDFVLAIGDDSSDEPMFEHIASNVKIGDLSASTSFAVTVGKKPTAAAAYLDDPEAVIELLTSLSKSSYRENKYFSSIDLTTHGTSQLQSYQQPQQSLHQQVGQPVGASVGASTTGQVVRSTSVGNLDIKENLPRKSLTGQDVITAAALAKATIPTTPSQLHLSMNDYMNSISAPDEGGEDDEGIFF